MSAPVVTLKFKSSARAIYQMLKENKFDGFPVVNNNGSCVGLISRHSLIVVLNNLDKIESM